MYVGRRASIGYQWGTIIMEQGDAVKLRFDDGTETGWVSLSVVKVI